MIASGRVVAFLHSEYAKDIQAVALRPAECLRLAAESWQPLQTRLQVCTCGLAVSRPKEDVAEVLIGVAEGLIHTWRLERQGGIP